MTFKILFSFILSGHAATYMGREQAVNCGIHLQPAIETIIDSDEPIMTVGNWSDIANIMVAAGFPLKWVTTSLGWIAEVLSNADEKSGVLFDIREYLQRAKYDEKQLLICVLTNCSIKGESNVVHFALNPPFEIEAFHRKRGPTPIHQGWIENFLEEKSADFKRAIIIGKNSEPSTYFWSAILLHELAHFADFDFIHDWITANLRLLGKGELSDPLFALHVRVEEGKKPTIDEGFLRIFLESRAYRAQHLALSQLVPELIAKEMAPWLADTATKDIWSFYSVTGHVARRYNINKRNALYVGEKWAAEMRSTIARAGLLSLNQ